MANVFGIYGPTVGLISFILHSPIRFNILFFRPLYSTKLVLIPSSIRDSKLLKSPSVSKRLMMQTKPALKKTSQKYTFLVYLYPWVIPYVFKKWIGVLGDCLTYFYVT